MGWQQHGVTRDYTNDIICGSSTIHCEGVLLSSNNNTLNVITKPSFGVSLIPPKWDKNTISQESNGLGNTLSYGRVFECCE